MSGIIMKSDLVSRFNLNETCPRELALVLESLAYQNITTIIVTVAGASHFQARLSWPTDEVSERHLIMANVIR